MQVNLNNYIYVSHIHRFQAVNYAILQRGTIYFFHCIFSNEQLNFLPPGFIHVQKYIFNSNKMEHHVQFKQVKQPTLHLNDFACL
jgi:hypothetical protein